MDHRITSDKADIPRSHCRWCRMNFRVAEPASKIGEGKNQTTVTRCSVPGCGQRFWNVQTRNPATGGNMAVVGIFPDDAPRDNRTVHISEPVRRVVLDVERKRKGRVGISMGGGHAQVIRHAPEIAAEPGDSEGGCVHDPNDCTAREAKQ